jgi:hypothetical protein
LKDATLAPHFEWDAQRLSKFDGEKWVRFYDEPWTANEFARVQVRLATILLICPLILDKGEGCTGQSAWQTDLDHTVG